MNDFFDPTGESSNHKLAAVFETRPDAERAQQKLNGETTLGGSQIQVLDRPSDPIDRALLPESRGIGRTLIRSHLIFGAIGACSGFLIFLTLNVFGLPFVANNPIAAFLVLLHVSTLSGLLVGGLVSLRPDQVPYIRIAKEALQSGRSVLVVHAKSSDELGQARGIVEGSARKVVATA